jgi:hypothetical protein
VRRPISLQKHAGVLTQKTNVIEITFFRRFKSFKATGLRGILENCIVPRDAQNVERVDGCELCALPGLQFVLNFKGPIFISGKHKDVNQDMFGSEGDIHLFFRWMSKLASATYFYIS